MTLTKKIKFKAHMAALNLDRLCFYTEFFDTFEDAEKAILKNEERTQNIMQEQSKKWLEKTGRSFHQVPTPASYISEVIVYEKD